MTITERIEAISTEIETARETRMLRDEQIKTIKRHIEEIDVYGEKTDEARRRFESALLAHMGSNARGTTKISEACYVSVTATWRDLLPRYAAMAE